MALLLVSTTLLVSATSDPIFNTALAAQALFYASVGLGGWLQGKGRRLRLFNAAYLFSVMNAAAVAGLVRYIGGRRNLWRTSEE
jgi:hypothetical protein